MENEIVNPKRQRQIEEFFDKESKVMTRYYELLEKDITVNRMKEEMTKLINRDPDFYDPYLVIADILILEGKSKDAKDLLYTAYEIAMKRIVDKDGNFPKMLIWGWLDNRHINYGTFVFSARIVKCS